jgi:ATP-dependent Clp protease ATP-binding subunit ClpC
VFNILLQILEDGRLTDSQGRLVDFRNTVIIMTSNVGGRMITEPKRLGFIVGDDTARNYEDMKSNVMGELKKTFRPEFLNRVDDIIVFHPLSEENIKNIVGIMLEVLVKRLAQNTISIEVRDDVKAYLAKKGFDPVFGARPLRRSIQSMIEDKLAENMLEGSVKAGDTVKVELVEDKLEFNVKKPSSLTLDR